MIISGIIVLCVLALIMASIPVYLIWEMNHAQAPDELERENIEHPTGEPPTN